MLAVRVPPIRNQKRCAPGRTKLRGLWREGRDARGDQHLSFIERPPKPVIVLADLDDLRLARAGRLLGLHGVDPASSARNCLAWFNVEIRKNVKLATRGTRQTTKILLNQ